MAETVKKSRIVSDEEENLEAALLEEFNTRLKHCMSKDDLHDADDVETFDINESSSNNAKPRPKNGAATDDFLRHEREHGYDVPASLLKNGGRQNGHATAEAEENIYETLPEPEKTEPMDQYVDESPKTPKTPAFNLNLDLSPNIDVDSPNEERPGVARSPDDGKSVKDRMFLMADDAAATLLFTQTVTSPMLTPSEENIDFLKGFQRETTNSDESNSNESPHKESNSNSDAADAAAPLTKPTEIVYENVDQKPPENIYENLKEPVQENLYENLQEAHNGTEDCSASAEEDETDKFKDHIYQEIEEYPRNGFDAKDELIVENNLYNKFEHGDEHNYEEIRETGQPDEEDARVDESYSEFLYHSRTESNYYGKYAEVAAKNAEINNREKDTETVPPEIVKNLKSQFSKVIPDVVNVTKKEMDDVGQLKMVNIMKQINKFELKQTGDGEGDGNRNGDGGVYEESTVTETYSETTTIQSDAPEEKVLKKKKTKKSRKEEKENISVNNIEVVNGFYSYNVNVKKLCRSFVEKRLSEDKNVDVKNSGRTKSFSEVLLASNIKNIENVFSEVSVRALKEKFNIIENKNPLGIVKLSFKNNYPKSSFSKFDALQKKNVLHIRSSDSAKAQEKFNGAQIDMTNCKACSKQVFQMEQIKAEKAVWHKNCFRCSECSKQLTVETYVSHEGNLYCKPHFKSLFAPKVVEDDTPTSDKPDLGLEELQSLNVKERFQVFEHFQSESQDLDRGPVNVKKSPSILSKLARFQAKGMDVGVTDDALNGIPIEESSSDEEEVEEEVPEGEDPTLYRAKKVQKEKPFHFTNLSEVKNKWEHGEQTTKDERREERKQEIQSIRNKLFLGKQGKMKEAYQQAVMQSESCTNLVKSEKIESCDTKSIKERFEKGELTADKELKAGEEDDNEVYQSEISKKSRSLFLEMDANAAKQPQSVSPVSSTKIDIKKAREAYLAKQAPEDVVRSSEAEEVMEVKTADIQERFKFFETYREPEKERKRFRITPPRDPTQVKNDTPDREIYRDPEIVRSEDTVDDSEVAKASHTASKMLSKFRQMEESLTREPELAGPKPLKRFTPPPEPTRQETESEEESASGEENDEEEEEELSDSQKLPEDLIEAQKAARAKQLRAKFEKWEAQEMKREQNQSVNIFEEYGDESQVESTKSLRARFESMRETSSDKTRTPRVKVNRFVPPTNSTETCEGCDEKVYPLEKITVHGHVYHKKCFKCMECSAILRMDTYSYNQGLLYCTPHFKRLFISKGNYDTAFGLNQHKEKWNVNASVA
ncbi:unnamed protein product [Phyllotreta striolata]|uniref:LIM zinc-binding domain-containing protein n=1 Tax=Phyllotreta striolata TaxID=444603 RepID=A0A9N9XPW2_PHYSR|nr:unnamed protein product [Phyllotreta striolata]